MIYDADTQENYVQEEKNIENNIIRIRDLIIGYDNKNNLLNTKNNKINYNEVPYISTYYFDNKPSCKNDFIVNFYVTD